MGAVRTVHVVFKTHLDIGFTDLAANVRRAYLDHFIPQAVRLSRELEVSGGPERFVWTSGAWLVDEYLRSSEPAARADLDRAIRDGHVAWHALPFTTHSEMMDASLFSHGLSIAARLDATYGRRTIAAKMTDVPGHSIGIVPELAAAGVRYLHVGTNPGSATPAVPPTFLWRAPDGSEVVVNYAPGYGSRGGQALEVPGVDQALYVSLTDDNYGPPSAASVLELFAGLSERYPDAEIRAGRLDDFAAAVWEARELLPVLTEEIGDSWIHGIASDPTQVRDFRELQRLRRTWLDSGELVAGTPEHDDFSTGLLMVPEHTWGMDLKRFLPDFQHYRKADFAAARALGRVDPDANAPELRKFEGHPEGHPPLTFSRYESSWAEQRGYLDQAVAALAPHRAEVARQALRSLVPTPFPAQGEPLAVGDNHHLGCFRARFGPDGSLASLIGDDGRIWADEDHRLAAYHYVTYDAADYQRWFEEYHENMADFGDWVIPDFGKPGMEAATPVHQTFTPTIDSIHHQATDDADIVTVRLVMTPEASEQGGAPRRIDLRYVFASDQPTVAVELAWSGKDAYRLPEASWLAFAPIVDHPEAWRIDKLGTEVDPADVVVGGNRGMHAVGEGWHYRGSDRTVEVSTLDAPLVAPGAARLLHFDNAQPDLSTGFHVNLHNNVWGTNFRMWFEEDALFRFRLSLT